MDLAREPGEVRQENLQKKSFTIRCYNVRLVFSIVKGKYDVKCDVAFCSDVIL